MNKQPQVSSVDTIPTSNMLAIYGTNAYIIHYMLHNLFRGLKPIRRKYRLTINEIIFLNGMYLYCKHVNTCMSQDACLRFIDYYNLNKIKYYIGSLRGKGMIEVAEVINSYNRYKPTILGISVINEINGSYESCLYDWFNKYGISLWGLIILNSI